MENSNSDKINILMTENKLLTEQLQKIQKEFINIYNEKNSKSIVWQNNIDSKNLEEIISLIKIFNKQNSKKTYYKFIKRIFSKKDISEKEIEKFYNFFKSKNFAALEKVMDEKRYDEMIRAEIYTRIARILIKSDTKRAYILAKAAWEYDPKPFRQKWCAFRAHDAGEVYLAKILIDNLPKNIKLSESENKRIKTIIEENKKLKYKTAMDDEREKKSKTLLNENKELFDKIHKLSIENANRNTELDETKTQIDIINNLNKELKIEIEKKEQENEKFSRKYKNLENLFEKQKKANKIINSQNKILRENYNSLQDIIKNKIVSATYIDQENSSILKSIKKDIITIDEQIGNKLNTMKVAYKDISNDLFKNFRSYMDEQLIKNISYINLNNFFDKNILSSVRPWKQGWAASPDYIYCLVELIIKNNYDLIIEFGSGQTTLFCAKAIKKLKTDKDNKKTNVYTFEHLKYCYDDTLTQIIQENLEDYINLIFSPLEDFIMLDGTSYKFYTCDEELSKISKIYSHADINILIIVDGPPGEICRNSRYPAFTKIMKYFPHAKKEFFLDDYNRDDEKEIIEMWKRNCDNVGINYHCQEKKLTKGAVLFSIDA